MASGKGNTNAAGLLQAIYQAVFTDLSTLLANAASPGTTLYGLSEESGFKKPQTILDWSRNDYYQAQTPWVGSDIIERVEEFRKTML